MTNTSEIDIRTEGHAGRITLTRAHALNALTYDMAMAIGAALTKWRGDDSIAVIVIDAEGDKAFCAGGDIADLYATGMKGDFAYGQTFWRDEYRLNAALASYPKPIVTLMQGFTMGGGVGIGCHASHRIVCESSQIAMPECGIGLVPDVGGSLILANAPGHLGEYLALTTNRMAAGDAILCGFADSFVPQESWPNLIDRLCETGDTSCIAEAAQPAPASSLDQAAIDAAFRSGTLSGIIAALEADSSEFAQSTLKKLSRNSPLAMACATQMIGQLRGTEDLKNALALEYRYTSRSMEHGDFLEGIRAAIIDKDRSPKWKHALKDVPEDAAAAMLASLGANELTFD